MPTRLRLTSEQRTLRARIAANTRWAGENGKANAERAQAGLRAKFTRETRERFPELADAEIKRRAESAYRAHMQRLAFHSAKARGKRSASDGGGPRAA
jgi:hypothetical protein